MDTSKNRLLIAILIILIAAVGFLSWQYIALHKSNEDCNEASEFLEEKKDELTSELKDMYSAYDTLRTENDSMNIKLEQQKDRIKYLLSINASNANKINLYQKELGTLRDIMKSYIFQIDSLNRKNQILTADLHDTKNRLSETESQRSKLEEEKEDLSNMVEIASVLKAKNIIISPLNKNSKIKDKVDKIDKIRVCLTIRENNVVEAGEKMIYLRIARPDDIILMNPEGGLFEVGDEDIAYTSKRMLVYENIDIDECIYWQNDGSLIPGTYKIFLYENENLIGESSFNLK